MLSSILPFLLIQIASFLIYSFSALKKGANRVSRELRMRKISTHVSLATMKKRETKNEQKTRRKERTRPTEAARNKRAVMVTASCNPLTGAPVHPCKTPCRNPCEATCEAHAAGCIVVGNAGPRLKSLKKTVLCSRHSLKSPTQVANRNSLRGTRAVPVFRTAFRSCHNPIPCRRLAGPQWCQRWRLCFVFCVFCVASPRW